MDLLQWLMDSSSHAIFTLDRDGIITHINQQAKVRFGLYHNSQHPHPAGRLEPGDLVLIADTAIGADDGALRPEDLARIGIREPRLRVNDRLVAAGVFDMPGRRPVYRFLPDQDADSLCLETVCEGIPIRLSIARRSVTVTVRDTVYTIGYFRCIGQMSFASLNCCSPKGMPTMVIQSSTPMMADSMARGKPETSSQIIFRSRDAAPPP